MAIDLEAFLVALETRLLTIPGLNLTLEPVTSGTPPFGWIGLPPIPSYRMTMGNAKFQFEPTVTVLVSKTSIRSGVLALARFANPIGEQSIRACVEADRSLGGVVEDCVVDSFTPLGEEEVGILGYFGGRWDLRVLAKGN